MFRENPRNFPLPPSNSLMSRLAAVMAELQEEEARAQETRMDVSDDEDVPAADRKQDSPHEPDLSETHAAEVCAALARQVRCSQRVALTCHVFVARSVMTHDHT